MSNKINDEIIEQRKEAIQEKLAIIEEATIEGRTAGGFGLKRAIEYTDQLDRLKREGVCAL